MTDNTADKKSQTPQNRKKWIIENLTSLGLALFLVFIIRSSIVEAFKIPSGSMIPTLLIGDHIFVNKFAYGLKIPFSDLIGSEPIYIVKREPPKRGDIVVFIYPKDESFYYIKRVVGIPGDSIEIKDKVLYVNGTPTKREPILGPEADKVFTSLDDPKYSANNLELYQETLDQGPHTIMLDKNNYFDENRGSVQVPADQYFVMGDNRDFSNDSRFWGFVPMKNIKGKAMIIWLSLWLNFSDNNSSFRPERIGTILR